MPYPRQESEIIHDKTVSEHGAWFARGKPISREAMLKNVFRFGQMPDSAVVVGACIVVMSGLYLLWREFRLQQSVV